jgi:hypothetical protein
MEVIAAHADSRGERVETRQVFGFLNETTGFLHRRRVLSGLSSLVRTAPFTRSITGLFGRIASQKKLYILSSCPPGWARRPTIDAGRLNRIIKRAVSSTVTLYDRFPPGFITRESLRASSRLGH